MKDILLGNCDFAQIRDPKNNYLYIDKTKFLYDIIKKRGEYYFLSRPRRFGKSLTISTLEKIFEGRRDLFKGLAIDKEDYDWQEHPIIHIDWSNVEFDGEKENLI